MLLQGREARQMCCQTEAQLYHRTLLLPPLGLPWYRACAGPAGMHSPAVHKTGRSNLFICTQQELSRCQLGDARGNSCKEDLSWHRVLLKLKQNNAPPHTHFQHRTEKTDTEEQTFCRGLFPTSSCCWNWRLYPEAVRLSCCKQFGSKKGGKEHL